MDHLTPPSADDPNRWTPPASISSAPWRSHYPKLLSFARSLAPARYAEDVVQDAATIALRRLGSGSAPPDASAQEAMLYALVRDVATERTRQRYRRSAVEVLITGPTAALRTQRHEIVQVLDRVLATLPRRIAENFLFGPPYSDAELVEEIVAEQAIEVTPDMEELAEYLADRLPAGQQDAVTERLATVSPYRAWAAPLLALREVLPRAVLDVSPNDILRLERRVGQLDALRPAPSGSDRDARQRLVRSMLVRFIFSWGALVAVPILLIRYVPSLTAPDVREISSGTFNTPTGGAISLSPGAHLWWQTRPDSGGAYHARIEGSTRVLKPLPANLRITTPAALIELRHGTLTLDGSTPGVTRVTLIHGTATVTPRGLVESKATPLLSNSTVDVRYATPLNLTNPDPFRRF